MTRRSRPIDTVFVRRRPSRARAGIFAAYESARTGRKVGLPFATTAVRPIDLWKPAS
ncbi:MAG: hypothetical protein JNK23_20775 [Opitutaceae bacterium]|nr:hypothetical protein [Opitutaceae bacterium]